MDLITCIRRLGICLLFLAISLEAYPQDAVIKAFEESYSLENNGQYLQAAARLKQVVQSDAYETNLRLGWLYYQGGNINESILFYNRAIALKPYAIEPRFGIALPYSAAGRWDDVMTQYNKILEVDPQNSIANYRLALIYYNRAQFERAETYLEKVINLYPFDYDTILLFAWVKFQLGKTREARVLFNKVLMHTPGDASALEGLSLIR